MSVQVHLESSHPRISPATVTHSKPSKGYNRPKGFLFYWLPTSLIPYAELMRLHQPAGFYAFYFPHLTGIFLGAILSPIPPPLFTVGLNCLVCMEANIILRGAACAYNDALDAPFDRQVERCRYRPVARGAVSPNAGHAFAFVLALFWAITLAVFPTECIGPASLLAATMLIYPMCKRVTNFPQVVLGFSLALGQLIGMGSLGVDVWVSSGEKTIKAALGCMYLANVVNAMIYDTVYAHQDLKDDLKVGVLSMAVICQGRAKLILSLLSIAEVVLLGIAGRLLGLGAGYWLASVCGTAMVLACMLVTIRLDIPEECANWFKQLLWWTGGIIAGGLAIEYALIT